MVHEDLGPCQVKYNNVDLGNTEGGVKFTYEGVYKYTYKDQGGETIQNVISMGKKTEVVIPLSDPALAILEDVTPGGVDGTTKFEAFNDVGRDGRAAAKELVLTRIKDNAVSADPLDVLTLPVAFPTEKIDWGFGKDGQRVVGVTFIGLPSEVSAQVGLLWRIGPA